MRVELGIGVVGVVCLVWGSCYIIAFKSEKCKRYCYCYCIQCTSRGAACRVLLRVPVPGGVLLFLGPLLALLLLLALLEDGALHLERELAAVLVLEVVTHPLRVRLGAERQRPVELVRLEQRAQRQAVEVASNDAATGLLHGLDGGL